MVNGTTAVESVDATSAWDPSGRTMNQPWDLLRAPLERADVDVATTLPRLQHYAAMLVSWNQSFSNLISRNDESRVVSRHLLESLEPAHWMKSASGKRWMDLGSGGGLPAIPLHLAGVGQSWTLVEARRTKTLFLRRVAQVMDLTSVSVLHTRIETLIEDGAAERRFDGFTSRATLALGQTLELAAHFVAKGGEAFLWKGSGHVEEMESDPAWRAHWSHEGVLAIGDGNSVVSRFKRI
jgi:16S rRNA (guanine527-N7)-methyltransferase